MIFDKDGTLIEFDAFWAKVAENALSDVIYDLSLSDVSPKLLLSAIGVSNGVTDVNSVLCKGTYEEIGETVYSVLIEKGSSPDRSTVIDKVISAFTKNAHTGDVRPTCERLRDTLTALTASGKRLALVTTDNPEITRLCLEKLGVSELFEWVFTDDGETPQKPDPYCIQKLSSLTGIPTDRMVMIGDTMTDMKFAKNGGISSVAVCKGGKNSELLAPHATYVISRISELTDMMEIT